MEEDEQYDVLDAHLKFVEEFIDKNPAKMTLTEIGTSLSDFIKAYVLMKEKGDSPSATGLLFKNYKNCLMFSFSERTNELMKWIN